MTEVNAKLMTVVSAIRQSIETSGSPGLSVNHHPNAFFLNVIGAIDLLKAAELVLTRLEQYEQGAALRFKADVKTVYNKIVAEYKAGAVSIEDAMARIRSKAELLVQEGAIESAIASAQLTAAIARQGQTTEADAATAASAVDGH